ncbi:MAG: ATP phosphoribosyltransferase regulatory subunit [Lachnospiraceae bacterium]|nr:ATP phosphoribosyltransferase regulatory subunit [Lachnospiraceae bacterium]
MIPLLHTPEGVRDIYGAERREMRRINNDICSCMERFGYEEIQTPSFEYFDVFSSERGTVPSKDMYKFIERDGNTLVLRPDMTPQIARCAATYFRGSDRPIRLFYSGNTYINNSGYQLRLKETTQSGVELFGDDSVMADAEVVALTVECLKSAGLKEFQVEIGNAGFFRAIVNECGLNAEDEEELRLRVKNKNLFGISDFLAERNITGKTAELLLALPELFGSEDVLDRAEAMTDNEAARMCLERLKKLVDYLREYGVERYISFDLGMLSKYRYYTGIIFRAITYGTGEAIASGGRYDSLAEQFGRPMPAIGMSVTIDSLQLVLERQEGYSESVTERTVVKYSEGNEKEAMQLACKLRSEGKTVVVFRDDDVDAVGCTDDAKGE